MIKYIYDRCGKSISSYDRYRIKEKTKRLWVGDLEWSKDLCNDCAKKFDEFMVGKELKDE